MPRLLRYFALISVILFSFLVVLSAGTTELHTPVYVADNTPITVTTQESAMTSTSSTQASTPKKITKTEDAQVPAISLPTLSVTLPIAPPPPPIPDQVALDIAASSLRDALVNIICYAPAGTALHSTSGSGVIIDPKGIILTNAHIAQHFLLEDRGVSCTIRSGSPAADRYKADLIYIPQEWLRANADVLTKTSPNGTGEYDFAFLAINKSVNSKTMPSTFPYVPLGTKPSAVGTPIVIASYGAQFLATSQVQYALFPTIVFGSVKNIYTFKTNTIDVLALGGSAAAQEGSSGGGVADPSGMLVGTITTSTVTGATDTRSLDAITASYIRAEYASETGSALDLLLDKPTATSIADFAPQIKNLEAIITAGLP